MKVKSMKESRKINQSELIRLCGLGIDAISKHTPGVSNEYTKYALIDKFDDCENPRLYTILQIIPVNHKMVAVHETYSEDIVCLALIEFDTGVREIVPVQCGTDGLFMISNTCKGYVGIDFK